MTHRAVDAEAAVPTGTASNYFRSRDTLVAELFERISERLRPDPGVHAVLAQRAPSRALFADYVRDIVARLTAERDVTLALFELRLESARNVEVAERFRQWLHAGFAADVAFNTAARLPGGAQEIALFHYALDGLLLDRLTTSIDPATARRRGRRVGAGLCPGWRCRAPSAGAPSPRRPAPVVGCGDARRGHAAARTAPGVYGSPRRLRAGRSPSALRGARARSPCRRPGELLLHLAEDGTIEERGAPSPASERAWRASAGSGALEHAHRDGSSTSRPVARLLTPACGRAR